MNEDDTIVDDAQEAADFAGGFEGKTADKPPAKEKPKAAAETPRSEEPAEPEYVQITKSDIAELRAAAAKTASYDKQFAKAFGTMGGIQRSLDELRTQTPRDLEVKMPDQAFAKMAKDFPELAELSREEFREALANLKASGNKEPDPETIKKTLMDLEKEDLEDAYPDWMEIVGAVNDKAQADPDHPFRKWLAAKPAAYQDRINSTIRAPVIQRAIRLFQSETKAAAQKPAAPQQPRNEAFSERTRAAVQPRGDRSVTSSSGKSEQEQMEEGFYNR